MVDPSFSYFVLNVNVYWNSSNTFLVLNYIGHFFFLKFLLKCEGLD